MQKKRKGPKGPNPLSMKKKKLPEVSARSSQNSKADLSNAPSSTAVLSGAKRKRDSQDVYEGQGVGISDGAIGTPTARKRKRRRKPSAVPQSSP
jgi:U3 small nucleolar RNA-associated protein 23